MTVYVDLSSCTCAVHVIHAIEAALVAAGLRTEAEHYADEMRAMRPNAPETAALYAPACIVYAQETTP